MWSAAYAKPFIRSRTGYIFTPVSCLVYTSSILTEVPPTGYHCQGCPNSTPHLLLTTPARYLLLYSGVEEAIARVFSERSLVSRCSCRSFTSYYTGGQKKKSSHLPQTRVLSCCRSLSIVRFALHIDPAFDSFHGCTEYAAYSGRSSRLVLLTLLQFLQPLTFRVRRIVHILQR